MNNRYQVSLTSFVFDSGTEFTTVFKMVVGSSESLEHAFRIAYNVCKKNFDYETHDGESLQHVKILEEDKLVAMAKFMLRGDGPDTHHYLEWLQSPNAATVKAWEDEIADFENRPGATDFAIESSANRIVLLRDLMESKSLGPQRSLMKLIFQAEQYMGFPTTKVQRLEDDLGL